MPVLGTHAPLRAPQQKPLRQWWPVPHWLSAAQLLPSGLRAAQVVPLQYALATQSASVLQVVGQASAFWVAAPVQLCATSGVQSMPMLEPHARSSSTCTDPHAFAASQNGSRRWPWQEVGGASHTGGDAYVTDGQSVAVAQQSPLPQQ